MRHVRNAAIKLSTDGKRPSNCLAHREVRLAKADFRRRHGAGPTAAALRRGGPAYERNICIPRLLPLSATDLGGEEPAVTRFIVLRLERALRSERARGRAGHWAYDLNRHIGLHQAHAAETRRLTALECAHKKKRWQSASA